MSVNQSLTELRKAFEELRSRLSKLHQLSRYTNPENMDSSAWNDEYKDETSLRAIRLLRSLEAAAQEATFLGDQSTRLYVTRLGQEVNSVRAAVEGQIVFQVPAPRADKSGEVALGMAETGTSMLKALDSEEYREALNQLNRVRGVFFSACEDIRMLYELRLLPMEERDRIRQAVADAGMPEVADRLAKADAQRVDDPPASIGHCREALATTVHNLAKRKVGKSTDSFQADLSQLGRTKGFLPLEEIRVAVSLYSYLSTKWKSGEEPKPGDVEFALKQAYFFIDRLLGTASVIG